MPIPLIVPRRPAPAPERRRWLPWLLVAVCGLGVGSAAAFLYVLPQRRAARARVPRAPDPPDVGQRHGEAGRASDQGRLADAGVRTAIQVSRRPPPKPARDRAPAKPKVAKAAQPTGQLVLKSEPWAYVYVDGRNLRLTTSAKPLTLTAGVHRVELVNPALKLRQSFSVKIGAGEVVRKFVRLEGNY
jgi:hypothetical protein